MRSQEIKKLIEAVESIHGPIKLYGSDTSEEHGTCFSLTDIPATFSAHTQEGTTQPGYFDIQIESIPPGEYIYTSAVSLDRFLEIITLIKGPETLWPTIE